ncbi:FkbM family methyltransferase [Rhodoplanes azumiensis]|uniref:FkbM family methyltransferase n=1 Tax=Rhodoplanes azumiensis TaxID=1897628 RepID=A0ABW5ARH3_9BRAD
MNAPLRRDPLFDLLAPKRPTRIVDVGANPIDGDPPYKRMLDLGLCTVVGFEPQPDALARLNAVKTDREFYLPYALGSGRRATLRICHAPGMTSLLEPDRTALSHFPLFVEFGRVVEERTVETRRLDDVAEIDHLDLLKIDVQGSELEIFRNGRRRLAKAVAIHTEVSFVTLYKKQPGFGEIDVELRKSGFVPHGFAAIKKRMIGPMMGASPYDAFNQVVEADLVYVRDFTAPDAMDDEQLAHLALVAHHVYGSFDLAMNCIHHLVARGRLAADARDRYVAIVRAGAIAAAPAG